MPLREYQCDACGHRFEVIQKMSDAPLETCPKCGGTLQKLQAAPAFHLKGTGWYATDYAKQDPSSSKKEDKAKGSTDKSEAKADAATTTTPTGSTSSTASSPSPPPSSTPSATKKSDA